MATLIIKRLLRNLEDVRGAALWRPGVLGEKFEDRRLQKSQLCVWYMKGFITGFPVRAVQGIYDG